jgi:hypothetical protein
MILATEVAVILGGIAFFTIDHAWLRQENIDSFLEGAGAVADDFWKAGEHIWATEDSAKSGSLE